MFSNIEIIHKFSVTTNHKSCTLSHYILRKKKNITCKETFDRILFENNILHPNTGERNEVGIVMLPAQKVSYILSHSLKSRREALDQQKQFVHF